MLAIILQVTPTYSFMKLSQVNEYVEIRVVLNSDIDVKHKFIYLQHPSKCDCIFPCKFVQRSRHILSLGFKFVEENRTRCSGRMDRRRVRMRHLYIIGTSTT